MAFYYISPSGNNAAAGTSQGTAWQTFAVAKTRIGAGDTLWVMAGTFVEGLISGVPSGSSWNNKVRIAALTPGSATLRPSLGQSPYALAFTNFESYIEWDGINVDGTNVQYDTCRVESWLSGAPHHIRIQNCTITGSQLGGVQVAEASNQPQAVFFLASEANRVGSNELRNCTVVAALAYNDFCHGMYISSSDNLIENCDFSKAGGAQVQIYNGYGHDADRNIVRNNKCHDNQHLGVVDGRLQRGWGITASSGFDNQVYNNLIYNMSNTADGSAGISVYTGSRVLIYNNTIFNVQRRGIGLDPNANSCAVDNNIVYQVNILPPPAHDDYVINDGSSNSVGAHNLLGTNPQFTNSGTGDFTLQSGSPARDAGATIALVTTDYNGAARPVGPAYDIGAFEYGGAGGPGPDVPATGATIVLDSCTGSAGTGWTSHIGEIGAQWNTHPGSSAGLVLSDAGRVRGNIVGFDTFHFASGIPLTAEYDVSADFYSFTAVTDHTILLWGRMDPAARTGYFVMWNLTPNQFDLWVVNNNVYTLLGSYATTLPTTTNFPVRLEIRNATKKVFLDGTERISSSDNSVSGIGRCGIGFYGPSSTAVATNSTDVHLDNIKLVDVSDGPDVDPAGGTTFLQDTFTGVAGVSLVNHAGEIGFTTGNWALQAFTGGAMVLTNANRARGDGLAFGVAPTLIAPPAPATPSYDLTCNFFVFTLIPGNTYSWWIRTGTGDRTGYELVYDSVSTWAFKVWQAGSAVTLETFTLTPTAGAHQLIIRGRIPTKQVFIDGNRYLSVTDETIPTAGRIGISAFEAGADSTNATSLHLSDINGVNVGAVVGNPLLTWLPMTAVVQGKRGHCIASGYTPRNSGT